jgi:predicted nucleotidyltransferase
MEPDLKQAFRRRVLEVIEEDLAREADAAARRRSSVLPQVVRTIARARAEGRVSRAWLFGSFAWGSPGERSDVDVLVESADPDALAADLFQATERPAHVVELERAPTELVERVLRDGTPL